MSEERRRVLDMLEQGKINASEAECLLDALKAAEPDERKGAPAAGATPKYLRVVVEDAEDHVDVRVPMQLLRSGIKLASLIPSDAQSKVDDALSEKGINIKFSDINPETIEELVESMGELSINVDEKDGAKVRVFCE